MRTLFTTPERKTFWFEVPEDVKIDKDGFIIVDTEFKKLNDHIDFNYLGHDLHHRGLLYNEAFFDRKDYLAGKISHGDYYAQFVRFPEMEKALLACIGEKAFLQSTDEHLNDIPLEKWDYFNAKLYIKTEKYKVANNASYSREHQIRNPFMWSPSCNVCLGKTAGHSLRAKLKDKASCN